MPETCDEIFLDPQNPLFFCIKDKKNLFIQNVGHIWAYIHANSQDFWKSFNGSDKTKHIKKCGKKMQKNSFFKTTFWGTSKNQRLDLKVCADSSWLLVVKNGLKKHSSLIIDRVIDVWSRCKKRDGGGEGRGRRGGGPARVLYADEKKSDISWDWTWKQEHIVSTGPTVYSTVPHPPPQKKKINKKTLIPLLWYWINFLL